MSNIVSTRTREPGGLPGKGGRPSKEDAGLVEGRILAAATRLFIQQGYARTSLDQIAAAASAGKATVYARHGSKEALFEAVIAAAVARAARPLPPPDPALPVEDRLFAAGMNLLEFGLRPEAVGLMRLVISEAETMPELAQNADRICWEAAVAHLVGVLCGPRSSDATLAGVGRMVAEQFLDLVFTPHQLRALRGTSQNELAASAEDRVRTGIRILDALGALDPYR